MKIIKIITIVFSLQFFFNCSGDDIVHQPIETGFFPNEISFFDQQSSSNNRSYVYRYDTQNRIIEIKIVRPNENSEEQQTGIANVFYDVDNGNLNLISIFTDTFLRYDSYFLYDQNNRLEQMITEFTDVGNVGATEPYSTINFNYNNGLNRYSGDNLVAYQFDDDDNLIEREDEFIEYQINYGELTTLFQYQNHRAPLTIWFDIFFPHSIDMMYFTSKNPQSITEADVPLNFNNPMFTQEHNFIEATIDYSEGQWITFTNQTVVISYEERELQ